VHQVRFVAIRTFFAALCIFVQVNDKRVTFKNTDTTLNSYIALFANFGRKAPSNYLKTHDQSHPHGFPFCTTVFSALKQCGNRMPMKYFMFMETHWGGGGCYAQTDGSHKKSLVGALRAAIGFR